MYNNSYSILIIMYINSLEQKRSIILDLKISV